MPVFCLGISHHTASVAQREKFAVAPAALGSVLRSLQQSPGVREAVLLSTCNRVEIYLAAHDRAAALEAARDFLVRQAGFEAGFYHHPHPCCARHLFRVACGLDSMIVGETEILGQVKAAYASALEAGTTSSVLNRLFQQAFRAAKRVRSETGITRGTVSVGAAAVELAGKIFGDLSSCRVLVVGAGEAGELVARRLQERGVRRLVLANRTFARAAALAGELRGMAVHFEHWREALADADIMVSSTAAEGFLLDPETVHPLLAERGDRPLFLLDLAVPRDLDPRLNELDGVFLHDIDSLQAMAREGLELRRREIEACDRLVEEHVEDFAAWIRRREGEAGPAAEAWGACLP